MKPESELRALAAEIEWPQTPALRPELGPRRGLTWARRRLAAAVTVGAAVALAAVFAVPQSRGALLRFLGLEAVHVELVAHLPASEERSLSAGLGSPVTYAAARDLLGRPPLEPRLTPTPKLRARYGIVSTLFLHEGRPVLLGEIGGNEPVLKKIALTASVQSVKVGGDPGIWIAGDGHVVVFPHAAARLAGHVLVWQHGSLTLRLEGAHLRLRDALALAAQLG